MSAGPVTLDFSKSQPIAEGQPSAGGVSLDFSKAQPIGSGGAPTTEQGAASGDYANQQAHNQETAPIEQDQQHMAGDVADASPVQGLGTGGKAAQVAASVEGGRELFSGAKAGIKALTAKTAPAGAAEEILANGMKVFRHGESGQFMSPTTVLSKLAAEHPLAAKAAKAYGSYLALHIAHKLGLPLPKILEVIGE